MLKLIKTLKFISMMALASTVNSYANKISPDTFINNLSTALMLELEQHARDLRDNTALALTIANKVILPKVDIQGMSRSVLGRKVWQQMSPIQQDRFTNGFTNIVMNTYSRSLTGYNEDQIKILPMHKRYNGKRKVVVKSMLVRKGGQKISLKYRMILRKNSWKIYDVAVEGISLLQNFRTQFTSELSRGSIDDLIRKMERS